MSEDEYRSRADDKRDRAEVRKLTSELASLSKPQIESLPISPGCVRALLDIQRMKKQALARQLKFTTGLLADEDLDEIRRQLFLIRQPGREDTAALHRLEDWRERIISGDGELEAELTARCEPDRRQAFRQLVRNARREATATKGDDADNSASAKSARYRRELFRVLREIDETPDN